MSRIEYIDSDFATSGTSSNFSYQIIIPHNYNRCCILSANIPKSFYLVDSPYNTFNLTVNNITTTYTFPIGNYSQITFFNQFLTLVNTGGIVFSYQISSLTHVVVLSMTGGTFNSISFSNLSSLYRQFGFSFNSTNNAIANSITTSYIGIFQLSNVVFLRSDLILSETSYVNTGILQSISSANNPVLTSLSYQCTIDPRVIGKAIHPDKRVYHFFITDMDGFQLDLHGASVNFEILFFIDHNIDEMIKHKMLLDNMDEIIKKGIK
jgi:hypothetical protein